MRNQEVIRLIRNLPTMCEFTDAYGEPIDSDVYYEAVDIAISALQSQELQPTCNNLATDTISRQAAIDALVKAIREDPYYDSNEAINGLGVCDVRVILNDLPSAKPEIVRCKDCRKHNVHFGYKEDCCALYEWRGVSYGHEHDYQYCSHAERRTDEEVD